MTRHCGMGMARHAPTHRWVMLTALAILLFPALASAGGFSYKFKLYDAGGKEAGSARATLTTGPSGMLYKSALVKSDTLGVFMTHHAMSSGWTTERFKRRPPSVGARTFYALFRKGQKLSAKEQTGTDKMRVSATGASADTLVVDTRDPSDYLLLLERYGGGGGKVFLSDGGGSAEGNVTDGGTVQHRVGKQTATFTSKKVSLGSQSGLVLYRNGVVAGVLVRNVLALVDSQAKEIEGGDAAPTPSP